MLELRYRRAHSPDEAAAAALLIETERRTAAQSGCNTSTTIVQAVRNHLVSVLAATR